MSRHRHHPDQTARRHDHDDHDAQDGHGGHDGLPDLLDLDAEVLAESLRAVRADIASLADAPVRRILDLGAGTGTGTCALLQHFTGSHAVAVDGSTEMVARLQQRAEALGLTDRVTAVHADLDDGVPECEPVDLAWASASLHHLADPDRALAQVADRIRPGGLMAVVELTGFPRFLAEGAPGGAAEAKAHERLAADRADDMPAMGSDWGSRLARAGLVVELDRAIAVDLAPPLPAAARDYAFATMTRIRAALDGRLDTSDIEAFDRLLDGGPTDVRRRLDLRVTTQRQLRIARRPARS